jgi:MFS family permease
MDGAGFGKEEIGRVALAFAAGLVIFTLPLPWILRRFGPRATLSTALAGYALTVSAFPFMNTYPQIAAIRFLDGVFSICVWVSSETVVLSHAGRKQKAQLTSLYAIWLASGYVIGPAVARGLATFLTYRQIFVVAGVVAAGAGLYLASGIRPARAISRAPTSGSEGRVLSGWQLLVKIRTSCFASFSYGYFQAAVVLFLPLYLIEEKGIAADDTIILPGLFCLGMLLFSNLAGRLGDRIGHLLVMSILSTAGMACVFGFVFVNHYWSMCALVFVAGATLASMSPLALGLTGVVVPVRALGRANSIYNTFYASGILLGPPVSGYILARHGGALMLYHLAALWGVFVMFTIIFAADDPIWRARQIAPAAGD